MSVVQLVSLKVDLTVA
jgi:hypothetical protein